MKTKVISRQQIARANVIYTDDAGYLCIRMGGGDTLDLRGYLRVQGFKEVEPDHWKRSAVGRQDPEIVKYFARHGFVFAYRSSMPVTEAMRTGEIIAEGLGLRSFVVKESDHSYLQVCR